MCDTCLTTQRLVKKLADQLSTIEQVILHRTDAVMQSKWVSKETAMEITGYGESTLMKKQLREGYHNPDGIFRTRLTGANIQFLRADLDAFDKRQMEGAASAKYAGNLKKAI